MMNKQSWLSLGCAVIALSIGSAVRAQQVPSTYYINFGQLSTSNGIASLPAVVIYCPGTAVGSSNITAIPCSFSGGGGGGGAVTAVAGAFVDGALASMGTKADTAYAGTGSASEIAIEKGIYQALISPLPAGTNTLGTITAIDTGATSSFADGAFLTMGTKADTAYVGTGSASEIAIQKGIYNALVSALPAGTNNIGTVTLGTGSNSIGSIVLGAGSNVIGSLATGSNTIGNVGLTQVYQSGTTWAATQYGFQNLGYATSSAPSYTTGNLEPFSESLKGQLYINLGAPGTVNPGSFANPSPSASASYGPLVLCAYNSTPFDMATGYSAPTACDTASQLIVNTESEKASYTYVALITPASGPTDIETVCGSATKTVRVHGAHATTNAGTLGSAALELIKRSTADTGGTSATVTAVPLDANDAAATATVTSYSVNPTSLGTSIGMVDAAYLSFGVSSTSPPYDRQFGAGDNEQSIVLRGTASCLGIGFAGATLPGGSVIAIEIKTTED